MSDELKEVIASFIALVLIAAFICAVVAYNKYLNYCKMEDGYHWVPTVKGHWEKDRGK